MNTVRENCKEVRDRHFKRMIYAESGYFVMQMIEYFGLLMHQLQKDHDEEIKQFGWQFHIWFLLQFCLTVIFLIIRCLSTKCFYREPLNEENNEPRYPCFSDRASDYVHIFEV